MTEEQRQLLHRPFAAVKAEFTDLDWQRWTQTALRMRQPHQPKPQRRVPRQSEARTQTNGTFVVLTNADLASFAPQDTIRASSSSSSSSFPFSSHSNVTHTRLPLPLSTSINTQLRD
ncbi:hypothetical protein GALMADRAFT_143325 [Galerina marginata CBS 339.88]|uniref:Uncharacterized protein n=1 Tax=Galerina marginata (strain CBS 339.88) TaxID=685588 RepID=A0A067SM34_GALM3|nr:hypothetical protein GALMADRAFT_143325 [Galerina marginata CBS 339.88]